MHATTRLDEARAAYARRDWAGARDAYRAASGELELSADDRFALSQCCWWLGDADDAIRDLEQAHHLALEEGDPDTAASAALELGMTHLARGDEPVSSGWIGRAARLAGQIPEGPVHGYVALVLEVELPLSEGDPGGVIDAARRVQQIGERCGDPMLLACGLNGEGRALINADRATAGVALLDEAMVTVLVGDVADDWASNVYCTTIAACHELGDVDRMARWTEAVERWLDAVPATPLFAEDCRVHRAQLLTLRGEWDRAEREALRACEELAGVSVVNAAEGWYALGEVRRRRGDPEGAEEAYQRAHGHGLDPQPGLALLRAAQGRTAAAATSIRAALLATTHNQLRRARLCAARVTIAIAGGQLDVARQASEELDEIAARCASRGLEATAAAARGAVLQTDGQPERALMPLHEACRMWLELEVPYEAARTRVLLARAYDALGDDEAAERELDAAAPVFDRLGAQADAAEVAGLRGSQARPAGLSGREVEVLRLVADGRSNPQIATALFISRRTVARHLANIFTKLGVSSRTEAARFAFDHGLLPERSD